MSPVNVPAIGAYIREQREQAKISLRQLAQAAGVSNPYLSQIERGLRRPSADILQQIARGLRISAEALYVQAGFLEDRPPGLGVRDAVLADPELTERQKQMLLEVYESFRKESTSNGRDQTVLSGEVESESDGSGPAGPEAAELSAVAAAEAGLLDAESAQAGPAAESAEGNLAEAGPVTDPGQPGRPDPDHGKANQEAPPVPGTGQNRVA